MEHLAEELDGRRPIWVRLVKCEQQLKGAVFERCVRWPRQWYAPQGPQRTRPEDHCVPHQQVVCAGRTRDPARRIGGQTLKVADQTALRWRRLETRQLSPLSHLHPRTIEDAPVCALSDPPAALLDHPSVYRR